MVFQPTRLETLSRLKETLTWLMQCRALQTATGESATTPDIIDECDEFGINAPVARAMLALYPDIAEEGERHAEQIWHFLERSMAGLRH